MNVSHGSLMLVRLQLKDFYSFKYFSTPFYFKIFNLKSVNNNTMASKIKVQKELVLPRNLVYIYNPLFLCGIS